MTRKLLTDFELMILLAVLRVDDAYGVPIRVCAFEAQFT